MGKSEPGTYISTSWKTERNLYSLLYCFWFCTLTGEEVAWYAGNTKEQERGEEYSCPTISALLSSPQYQDRTLILRNAKCQGVFLIQEGQRGKRLRYVFIMLKATSLKFILHARHHAKHSS